MPEESLLYGLKEKIKTRLYKLGLADKLCNALFHDVYHDEFGNCGRGEEEGQENGRQSHPRPFIPRYTSPATPTLCPTSPSYDVPSLKKYPAAGRQ